MDSPNTLNVLLTMPFSAPLVEKISAVSPRIVVTQREARTTEEVADVIGTTDILYTWNIFPNVAEAPRLRWVQLHQAGIDTLLEHPLYANSDVAFTTASGVHAIPMAEYAMAMILAFAHHMPQMMEDKISGLWPKERWNRYLPKELYGATIGIVGYGSIGRQIARLAVIFGMKVLAMKRDLRQPAETNTFVVAGTGDPEGDIPERMYPPEALHSFLSACDFVVLTVPLTGNTKHLIDADALKAVKPDAVIINVARGDVIDEAALIDALQHERLRGAALDVFSQEPLPADNPLWTLPNVIMSPHIAGLTPLYYERAADLFAENLRRFLAGEPLLNQVDRGKGY
jgi:phosphoglycerate dehydrogenase-like enzyme